MNAFDEKKEEFKLLFWLPDKVSILLYKVRDGVINHRGGVHDVTVLQVQFGQLIGFHEMDDVLKWLWSQHQH